MASQENELSRLYHRMQSVLQQAKALTDAVEQATEETLAELKRTESVTILDFGTELIRLHNVWQNRVLDKPPA